MNKDYLKFNKKDRSDNVSLSYVYAIKEIKNLFLEHHNLINKKLKEAF